MTKSHPKDLRSSSKRRNKEIKKVRDYYGISNMICIGSDEQAPKASESLSGKKKEEKEAKEEEQISDEEESSTDKKSSKTTDSGDKRNFAY